MYRRVLLKLSGEALMGGRSFGLDWDVVSTIARQVREVRELGVELALVIGGGNIFRGVSGVDHGMDRVSSDYMGMLATIINSLAMQNALEREGIDTRVLSAIEVRAVAEPYIRRRAIRHLEKGRVTIIAAGTGNPYFTTDTAAALRAMEIKADVILKGTRVDGVYSSDPEKHADATRLERVTYLDVLKRGLRVMDSTAISLCMENSLPIVVFDLMREGNIRRVVRGESVGSRSKGANMVNEVLADVERRMNSTLEAIQRDLASVRTGRASLAILDGVKVDYYGTETPLNQVATLSVPEPSLILAQPWDPSSIEAIEKAVLRADLGLNPSNDGKVIRIPIPPLTEERRVQLARRVGRIAEEGKTALRQVRRDGNEKLKSLEKDKEISQDDERRGHEAIQKLIDRFSGDIEALAEKKEAEVMEV